jgi:hypothetical protein
MILVFLLGLLVGNARPTRPRPACICGHEAEAHEHYRAGLDCGECGPDVCDQYVATTPHEQREHEQAMAYASRLSPAAGLVDLLEERHRARADAAVGRVPLH